MDVASELAMSHGHSLGINGGYSSINERLREVLIPPKLPIHATP